MQSPQTAAPLPVDWRAGTGAPAPFSRRLGAYLAERFPLLAYLPLILAFFASAGLTAGALGGGRVAWGGAAVLLLAFFRLRVFDDLKDHEEDRRLHPGRVLSKGFITLGELRRTLRVTTGVEGVFAAALGPWPLGAWLLVLGFSFAMRWEFGAGSWLRGRPLLYALTHNPILPLLALFGAACATAPIPAAFGWHLAMTSAAGLAYELGRKSGRYLEALGAPRARALLTATQGITLALTARVIHTLPDWPGGPAGAAALALAPGLLAAAIAPPWRDGSARRLEASGAVFLLGVLGVTAAAALLGGAR